ncbi:MAG: hypothetical protein IPL46_00270 [Saprospiraceae bacterium]|nr:hypothetical protein [Saprospiraceae bacterium]
MRILIIGLLAYVFTSSLAAQTTDKRYSEEEVTVEKQFIEAKKYKLLGDFDGAKSLLSKYSRNTGITMSLPMN